MENPAEKLLRELAQEKKDLQINITLTIISLLGLMAGVYFQLSDTGFWYVATAFAVSYLAGGLPAAKEAISSLLKKDLNIDLLMVLAALAAALVGEVRDGAILLFLFSLAGTLEEYAMGNTKRAVVSLMKLRPEKATIKDVSGEIRVVSVEEVCPGDLVLVRAGERFPVDGIVLEGHSSVDQSSVTGESVPVEKIVGDEVFSGSVNGHGTLLVQASKAASQSTISMMIKLVTEAQSKRSPSENFSDWFGEKYTIVVLVGSFLALMVFILLGIPYEEAFYKAATLLVVASPCAIVISVPAAVLSALAASAKRGLLFKGGAALETFGRVDIIAFDKTGTLTEGKMQVTNMSNFAVTESELLSIAVAIESQSEHPLAESIIQFAKNKSFIKKEAQAARITPGKGITATIDNKKYWAGNRKMLTDKNISVPASVLAQISESEQSGKTVVIVGDETMVLGLFSIADTPRQLAQYAVAQLRSSGIKRIVMLTGDNSSVAKSVAKELGISEQDVFADLLPTDKVDIVNQLKKEGTVAFVGDGVNDAAALVTSDVGIVMGSAGSDVAIEAADVALLSDDLGAILKARKLAKQTNRIIKQNLFFALGILLLMVVVTVFFYLPLPLGVIGHEGGTLLVVLNGLRLLFLK